MYFDVTKRDLRAGQRHKSSAIQQIDKSDSNRWLCWINICLQNQLVGRRLLSMQKINSVSWSHYSWKIWKIIITTKFSISPLLFDFRYHSTIAPYYKYRSLQIKNKIKKNQIQFSRRSPPGADKLFSFWVFIKISQHYIKQFDINSMSLMQLKWLIGWWCGMPVRLYI